MNTSTYPIVKLVATALGIAICGVETWLNAEYIAQAEGWGSSLVAVVITASVGAAAALPIAEHACKSGQWLKGAGLILFFLLMAGFSLTSSLARMGGKHDGEVSAARAGNARVTLAREAYDAAKSAAEAECADGRGNRCRAAEKAVTEARKGLQEAPIQRQEDPMARRIAAVLPVSQQTVELYQPLLAPLALQLGGFLLLAFGFAPAGREADPWTKRPEEEAAPINLAGEADAYRWLLDRILASPGRQLQSSGRELAAMAGIKPATFALWLKRWTAEKKIVAARSGKKTVFSLPKLRQVA